MKIACIIDGNTWQTPTGVATFCREFLRLNERPGFDVEVVVRPTLAARCAAVSGQWSVVSCESRQCETKRTAELTEQGSATAVARGAKAEEQVSSFSWALGYLRELISDTSFFLRNRSRIRGRILLVNEFGCETLPIAARIAFPFARIIAVSHTYPGMNPGSHHPVRRFVEQLCERSVSEVIFNSTASRGLWENRLGRSTCRNVTIPLGLDAPSNGIPSDYPAGHEGAVDFVCIARFVHCKGHRKLLEAWRIAVSRTDCRIRLILVGDGPTLDETKRLAATLDIADTVLFLGSRPDGASFYNGAAAGVLLSIEPEAFGLVLIEAMSRGKPVIASRIGGIGEIVEDGWTGLLVDPLDPENAASAICRLAGSEPERLRMGSAGRERWLEKFTVDLMLDNFAAHFKRGNT